MFKTSCQRRFKGIFRSISAAVLVTFLTTSLVPPQRAYAQELNLPAAGTMLKLTHQFMPSTVKGIKIDPKNPLSFVFLIDPGQTPMSDIQKREEYRQLVKYFLAALTTPEKDMWVNLSPYEKNRLISDNFGETEMGRNMLGQDYLLKQLTASLVYPEDSLGKKFWERVYSRVQSEFGGAQVPVNTFNKVWIVPASATVYEKGNVAMVVKSRLKVLMEEDYLALDKNANATKMGLNDQDHYKAVHSTSSQVMKEVIIPEIEREVNEGANFAQLRQMYNSMILASWFKGTLKQHLLTKVYANQNKSAGVELENPEDNNRIYQQYIQAFKKGVYNYIKEETDQATGQSVPRKYFSGGFNFEGTEVGVPGSVLARTSTLPDAQMQGEVEQKLDEALVTLDESSGQIDVAMAADVDFVDWFMSQATPGAKIGVSSKDKTEAVKLYPNGDKEALELNSENKWVPVTDATKAQRIIDSVKEWPPLPNAAPAPANASSAAPVASPDPSNQNPFGTVDDGSAKENSSSWTIGKVLRRTLFLGGLVAAGWFGWNRWNAPSSESVPQAAPATNVTPAQAMPAQAAQTNVWIWNKHPQRTNAFYATNPGFPGVTVFRDENQQLSLQTSINGAWKNFGTNTFALNQALSASALKAAETPKKPAATNVALAKPVQQGAKVITQTNWVSGPGGTFRAFNPNNRSQILIYDPKTKELKGATWNTNRNNWSGPMSAKELEALKAKVQALPVSKTPKATKAPAAKKDGAMEAEELEQESDVAMAANPFRGEKRDYQWKETDSKKYFYTEYNHEGETFRIYISQNGRSVDVSIRDASDGKWYRIADKQLERNIISTVNNWPVERKSGWSLRKKIFVFGPILLGLGWFAKDELHINSAPWAKPPAAAATNAAPAQAVPAQTAQTNVWVWNKHPQRTNAFYATNPGFPGVTVFRDENQQLLLQTSTNGAWKNFGTNTFALNQALSASALKAAETPKKPAATNAALAKPVQQGAKVITQTNWVSGPGGTFRAFNPNNRSQILIYDPKTKELKGATWNTNRNNWSGPMSAKELEALKAKVQALPVSKTPKATNAPAAKKDAAMEADADSQIKYYELDGFQYVYFLSDNVRLQRKSGRHHAWSVQKYSTGHQEYVEMSPNSDEARSYVDQLPEEDDLGNLFLSVEELPSPTPVMNKTSAQSSRLISWLMGGAIVLGVLGLVAPSSFKDRLSSWMQRARQSSSVVVKQDLPQTPRTNIATNPTPVTNLSTTIQADPKTNAAVSTNLAKIQEPIKSTNEVKVGQVASPIAIGPWGAKQSNGTYAAYVKEGQTPGVQREAVIIDTKDGKWIFKVTYQDQQGKWRIGTPARAAQLYDILQQNNSPWPENKTPKKPVVPAPFKQGAFNGVGEAMGDVAMTVGSSYDRDRQGFTFLELIVAVAVVGLLAVGIYKYKFSSSDQSAPVPVAIVPETDAGSAPTPFPDLIPAPPVAAPLTNAAAKPRQSANPVAKTNAPAVKKPVIKLSPATVKVNTNLVKRVNPTGVSTNVLGVWENQAKSFAAYTKDRKEALVIDKTTWQVRGTVLNSQGKWVDMSDQRRDELLRGIKGWPQKPATGSKTNATTTVKEPELEIVHVQDPPPILPAKPDIKNPAVQAPSATLNNVWQAIKDVSYANNKTARVEATLKLARLMDEESSKLDPESRKIAQDFLNAAKENPGSNTSRMRKTAEEMRQLINKRIADAAKGNAAYGGIDFDDQYLQKNIIGEGMDVEVLQGFDWLLNQPITGFTPRILDIHSGFGFTLSFFNGIVTPQLRLAAAQNAFGTNQTIDIADNRYGREVLAKV